MGMASPQTRWTAAMVRTLPDDRFRHEVVDGIHLVTPAPSWTHQDAVQVPANQLEVSYVVFCQREHIGDLDLEFRQIVGIWPGSRCSDSRRCARFGRPSRSNATKPAPVLRGGPITVFHHRRAFKPYLTWNSVK
jgi:hypothetical protein